MPKMFWHLRESYIVHFSFFFFKNQMNSELTEKIIGILIDIKK